MKKLYITNNYKYYKKSYQNGKYIGVHNWKYLRNEIKRHEDDEEYINEQTHNSYGFIYGDTYEYNRIVGKKKARYADNEKDPVVITPSGEKSIGYVFIGMVIVIVLIIFAFKQ